MVRAQYLSRTDVLDRVKALALSSDDDTLTTAQVAEYYEVDVEVIRHFSQRNKGELLSAGYYQAGSSRTSPLAWPRKAILVAGMALRDSEVAKAVRSYLLIAETQA